MKSRLIFLLVFTLSFVSSAQDCIEVDVPTTTPQADQLNFPLSQFASSKMPMHVVFPRTDRETQNHARHKWAHPNMRYQIPIGVQGGAWPFKYEILKGPESASIGSYYNDEDYGVLQWHPTQTKGTFKFHVKVTDQELSSVDVIWNVTIDADKFVFIKDGVPDNGDGSFENPLEDIQNWYKNDRDDDSFTNKIIVFREGLYEIRGDPSANGNLRLDEDSKTGSLIGFPGETAVLNSSSSKVITDEDGLDDIYIADLKWVDSRQDVNNAHFIWAMGDVNRMTVWNNKFSNHGPGTKGTDNPAGVFISSTDSHKKYVLYKHNEHDYFLNGGQNGSYVDIYYASYVLIEQNTAKNSDNLCGFWAKGTTSYVTIRANTAIENITRGGICVGYGYESPEVPHSHEIAWNHIVYPAGNARYETLKFAGQKSREGQTYNSYVYRNTFVNGSAWIRFPGKENYKVDSNLVVSNNLNRWNEEIMDIQFPNLTGKESDGITDEQGLLTGQYRRDYLGVVGHELP